MKVKRAVKRNARRNVKRQEFLRDTIAPHLLSIYDIDGLLRTSILLASFIIYSS
jgi:hypothetical protein